MGKFKAFVSENTPTQLQGLAHDVHQRVWAHSLCIATNGKKKAPVGVLLLDGNEMISKVHLCLYV